MAKMQPVKYASVNDTLDHLPEDELDITLALREIVFECIPEIQERLSYNVPFYKRHKGICFIWPGAVKWGKNRTNEGVRFGFNYGTSLTDELGLLEKGDRKSVAYLDVMSVDKIPVDALKAYLFEAAILDEEAAKKA